MEFVDPIFNRGAREHEGVAAFEAFDGLGCLGVPILDALGFVEDHDVGLEACVYVERVGHHLFIVDDGEKRARIFGICVITGPCWSCLGVGGEPLPTVADGCRRRFAKACW